MARITMNIRHVTIHQLLRRNSTQPAELRRRDQELSVDESLQEAITTLKQRYLSQGSKQYSTPNNSHDCSQLFRRYLQDEIDFSALSHALAERMVSLLNESETALELNLIFVEELLLDDRIFYLFCVEESPALTIDQTLQLSATRHLDLQKVSATVRFQLSQWMADHPRNTLALHVGRAHTGLGELLSQMFDFSEMTNTRQETGELLDVVSRYAEQMPQERAFEVKNQVVDYCLDRSAQGDAVKLEELSAELDQSAPGAFVEFAQQNSPELPTEIQPERAPLKKLVRFSGRGHGVSLTFSADLLGSGVVYDAASESLVITKIPRSLLAQLKQGDE